MNDKKYPLPILLEMFEEAHQREIVQSDLEKKLTIEEFMQIMTREMKAYEDDYDA